MADTQTHSKNSGERIAVRFGDPILQDGHTAVPNLVLNSYSQLGISPAEMLFVIHVWQFWWTERHPYPSLNTIATRMHITRRQARNYVQSLKQREFVERPDLRVLVVRDRFEPGLGQVSSEYDFAGLIEAVVLVSQGQTLTPRKDISEGGRKNNSEAPRNHSSSEEDEEEKDEERINLSNIRRNINSGLIVDNTGDNSPSHAVASSRTRSPKAADMPPNPSSSIVGGGDNGTGAHGDGVESVGQVLKRSRGRPPKQPHTEERQQIHAYIRDFAPQLGDQAPLVSSVTRAYNLYLKSGWPFARFIDALYQARAKTRERSGGIRTTLPKDDPWGTKPKMAYFFSVLEDEVGLRDEEPATVTTR